jgi:7-carboxy-7-deazaguanine synthase (Cx14CxxC type)
MYQVKEMFYSLQGEGARSGRAAVFCRFSKCNLWNGREDSRAQAVCNFCDTDILGIDGQNGGKFNSAEALAEKISMMWAEQQAPQNQIHPPTNNTSKPYVIFTGGEPLLQLDAPLIDNMHHAGFEVAIESNGTLPLPEGIDWVCLSPKSDSKIVFTRCNELKLVYPQESALPERFENFPAEHLFLSPKANPTVRFGPDADKQANTQLALEYCLAHPQWRLTLQLHKLLGID